MVEITDQILEDINNIELIAQIDREVCSKCAYSRKETHKMVRSTCDYSSIKNHSRPCHWTDCVKTGVFKLKSGARKGTWERLYRKYGANNGKE